MLKAASIALVACGLMASAAKLARAAGYLAVIGPAPLRFEPSTRPEPPPTTRLPALAQVVHPAPPPAVADTNTPATSARDYAPALPEPPHTNMTAPQPTAGPELPPVLSHNQSAPGLGLSPETILGYFVPLPTNSAAGQFQAPVFVPPMAPEPPSSRARYESR